MSEPRDVGAARQRIINAELMARRALEAAGTMRQALDHLCRSLDSELAHEVEESPRTRRALDHARSVLNGGAA